MCHNFRGVSDKQQHKNTHTLSISKNHKHTYKHTTDLPCQFIHTTSNNANDDDGDDDDDSNNSDNNTLIPDIVFLSNSWLLNWHTCH